MYEYISFNNGKFEGTTFGCSCCSGTDELTYSSAILELREIAEMYSAKANRYAKMAEIAKNHDISVYYSVWNSLKDAKDNLQAAHDYEDGKPCGTWQNSLFDIGYEILEQNLHNAEFMATRFPMLQEVADTFGW